MIRLVDIYTSEVDDSVVVSLRGSSPATVTLHSSGLTGLLDSCLGVKYRDVGSILTDLINRDEELVRDIERSRQQVRVGELLTHEEVFGG